MIQVTERQFQAMRAVVDAAEALVRREAARVGEILRKRLGDTASPEVVDLVRAEVVPHVIDPDLVDAVNAYHAVRRDEPSALQI